MLFSRAFAVLSSAILATALPANVTSANTTLIMASEANSTMNNMTLSTLSIASEADTLIDQHTPHHHIHCHHHGLNRQCRHTRFNDGDYKTIYNALKEYPNRTYADGQMIACDLLIQEKHGKPLLNGGAYCAYFRFTEKPVPGWVAPYLSTQLYWKSSCTTCGIVPLKMANGLVRNYTDFNGEFVIDFTLNPCVIDETRGNKSVGPCKDEVIVAYHGKEKYFRKLKKESARQREVIHGWQELAKVWKPRKQMLAEKKAAEEKKKVEEEKKKAEEEKKKFKLEMEKDNKKMFDVWVQPTTAGEQGK